MDHAQVKEQERRCQSDYGSDQDEFHREVAVGSGYGLLLSLYSGTLPAQFTRSQSDSSLDHAPRADDPDHTGHRDASDADVACISGKDRIGRHRTYGRGNVRIAQCQHRIREQRSHQRDDHPPHQQRTGADDGAVLQPHDIAQSQYGCSGIDPEDEFGFLGQGGSPGKDVRFEHLRPPAEGGQQEVVQTAHQSGDHQRTGLRTALLSRNEHLRGGCSLGEGVFAVHLFDEILAERDQEQNTEDTSQQRAEEYLQKIDRQLRMRLLQDVQSRQGKDGSGYDHARTGADRLDDDVLPQGFFPAEDSPTAMIEIGIAASNTWPIFSPRKAAAAEKITAIRIPQPTDQKVTSG